MKRIILVLFVCATSLVNVLGQGYVNFSNRVPEVGLDGPAMNGLNGGPWFRPNAVVQLYAAPDAPGGVVFVSVGDPVTLGSDIDTAGYWDFNDDLTRAVAFAEPGEDVLLQVRGWELTLGVTFEEASQNSDTFGFLGTSSVLTFTLGTASDPAYMVNEPPRSSFGGLGLFPNVAIPEPGTFVLFGFGVLLASARLRRSIRRNESS